MWNLLCLRSGEGISETARILGYKDIFKEWEWFEIMAFSIGSC